VDALHPQIRQEVAPGSIMQFQRLVQYRCHGLDAVQLVGIALLAIALVPSGAHLSELSHKLRLTPENYMTVQGIYGGWALFGFAIAGAFATVSLHTYLVRRNNAAFTWSVASLACIASGQLVFWLFTYPVNVETVNWTVMPADFEAARDQWEYSHAVGSAFSFLAIIALMRSIQLSRPFASMAILESIRRDAEVRAARRRALGQSAESGNDEAGYQTVGSH
jgi:hypothetical protein